MTAAAIALLLGMGAPGAEATPEVCPSVHPLQPCSWVPTEQGAYLASGSYEVVIEEGGEVTRITGTTELGEIVTDGGLPRTADLITVRALEPGSWIVGGSTDCTGCLHDPPDDGGDDGDGRRHPGRSGDAPGHTGEAPGHDDGTERGNSP